VSGDECNVCGEDGGGGSHYHCGRCGNVKPTGMMGHLATLCKVTGQRAESHMCCPGSCELNEPTRTITDATLLHINVSPGGALTSVVRDDTTGAIYELPGGPIERAQMVHPAVAQILRWFDSGHLPPHLAGVVDNCRDLATDMAETFTVGGDELIAGLRHLLQAKDCFVRAAITQREAEDARVRADVEAGRRADAT
jgi:hypothetical protein